MNEDFYYVVDVEAVEKILDCCFCDKRRVLVDRPEKGNGLVRDLI